MIRIYVSLATYRKYRRILELVKLILVIFWWILKILKNLDG